MRDKVIILIQIKSNQVIYLIICLLKNVESIKCYLIFNFNFMFRKNREPIY